MYNFFQPVKEDNPAKKSLFILPNNDIINASSMSLSNKISENKDMTPPNESTSKAEVQSEDMESDSKTELNFNGKMMKFSECKKSPVVGSFTPMTYHSTPNKEGKPLTKTMVDQQLHPNRHSDNVKKTIEVHTDSQKKQAPDESKSKPENQRKKVDDVIVTKDTSAHTENKITEPMESPDKKDLKPVDSDRSTNSNVDKKSTGNQNNLILDDDSKVDAAKVDTTVSTSKDTTDSAVVINKVSENIVDPPAIDMVTNYVKDLKSNDSKSPTKSNTDFVNISSDKEVPKGNQSAKEPSKGSSSNIDSEKDVLKSDISDSNKCDDKNAKAVSTLAYQDTENVIRKEVKTVETVQEATSSTIDLILNNDRKEDIKQTIAEKESNNIVSSTSSDQSKKTEEEPIGMPEECTISKIDKIQIVEDDITKVTDNPIPETVKQYINEDKIESTPIGKAKQGLKEDKLESNPIEPPKKLEEKAVLEVHKINEVKKSGPETAKLPASLVPIPKVEAKIALKKEKSGKIGNTSKPITIGQSNSTVTKIKQDNSNVLNAKEGDSTTKGVDSKNASTDSLSQSAKPIEPVAPKLMNPLSKSEITTVSTDKTILLDNIQQKPAPPVNKFIQVPKGIKVKIVPKAGAPALTINPIEKKTEQTPLAHSAVTTAGQLNEPKTHFKPDMLNPVTKGIETKVNQPITKEFELKTVSKTVPLNPSRIIEPVMKVGKLVPVTQQIEIAKEDKNVCKVTSEAKPMNNNHTAVPFGKWTDANRQEFLNKFKEIKVPATSTTKQIKNSNDLNRIDVLKKIDSQRHNNKAQDKLNVKDTMFSSKIAPSQETKIPVKTEGLKMKAKLDLKNAIPESTSTETVSSTVPSNTEVAIPQPEERREVYFNDLIGRAIVDMLNRPVPMPMTRSPLDEPRHVEAQTEANEPQNSNIDQHKPNADQQKPKPDQQKQKMDQKAKADQRLNDEENSSGSLDDIEMKMNELHGIPFVERPPHELPKVYKTYSKSGKGTKQSKGAKKLLPTTSKQPVVQDNVIDIESDEEVIEHEPITGDMDQSKKVLPKPVQSKAPVNISPNETPKESVITENDFDKFARRNSKSLENCLAVKFDSKEPTNVVQTVKEREVPQNYSLKMIGTDNKTKLPPKQAASKINVNKPLPNTKFGAVPENPNKNYQLKMIHSAYQSALTAKQQIDRPLNIIEDKPVKVVFMDTNTEFVPNQLNVQGKELSPAKKSTAESANMNPQPVIDATETTQEKYDETKIKTKHQRKQVLTPVETPELELIQPRELNVSPKRKRKTEDNKTDKSLKNLVHKKSYLLGRTEEKPAPQNVTVTGNETINRVETASDRTVSAIDSLVKAAELLENQSVQDAIPNTESPQNTPVKRGRGRPRKYPLPEGVVDRKTASPSPPKKPRLIDAKPVKQDPISDEDSTDEDPIIRENWTMGKINENIVCPICNKLFRSENVVFKHVKHCSGVSPTRSDLEKRKMRYSKDTDDKSESQSEDMDFDEKLKTVKLSQKKPSPKETPTQKQSRSEEIETIIIEDTPLKKPITVLETEKSQSTEEILVKSKSVIAIADNETQEKEKLPVEKQKKEPTLKEIADEKLKWKKSDEKVVAEKTDTKLVKDSVNDPAKKATKKTSMPRSSNLVCEFCGKSFRQPSYLANHKLQHQKEQRKKLDAKLNTKLQVFSCEVCKKEFRKLHHLVQHRIIHNPEVPTRTTRKSSSELKETKAIETPTLKQNDDTSAGFRCEPCDKSFRKLHHLVEHRETHDGINRQKTNPPTTAQPIEKPPPSPQCEMCKKSFRKLHHLIEHKEQYHNNVEQIETSSEKSDDKSVQSSLSTRDIIHECSLCYMVFPNEHSLNKHSVFCQQKKKRQSKAKDKPVIAGTVEIVEESLGTEDDSTDAEDAPEIVPEEVAMGEKVKTEKEHNKIAEPVFENKSSKEPAIEKAPKEDKPVEVPEIPKPKEKEIKEVKSAPAKRELPTSIENSDANKIIPEKMKKINEKKIELPKKTAAKDKVAPTVTKRQKSIAPLPVLPEDTPVKSSDEDEVRYMLNPNFKEDETNVEDVFMKVRSNKRNSLQIERPSSRDQFLVNRRTSLQHPPKIPRLKAKPVEPKVVPAVTKTIPKSKPTITAQAASTDSDDSDIKYSFPVTVAKGTPKRKETPKEKKAPRKSLAADKRKSLSGIAKRKSLGQGIAKLKANLPIRVIKRSKFFLYNLAYLCSPLKQHKRLN